MVEGQIERQLERQLDRINRSTLKLLQDSNLTSRAQHAIARRRVNGLA